MPMGRKTRTAIYHPPKSGMPYLVVTVSPEGVVATAVETKEEARILASDHQGFDAGGDIGLTGLARRPQQVEFLPYAR